MRIPLDVRLIGGIFLIVFFDWSPVWSQTPAATRDSFRVLSFNILQGGADAANVGFPDADFGGSRYDELAEVIQFSRADLVGVQEDASSDHLMVALGAGWQRAGSVYSKFEIELASQSQSMTLARVRLPSGKTLAIVNCHWRPSDYGPFLVQDAIRANRLPKHEALFEKQILKLSDKTTGNRGYQQTLDQIKPLLTKGVEVIVTGDFNEPSHLDWTPAAAKNGLDRWVQNPSDVPLRFSIGWTGSRMLAEADLRDAYRTVYPDEIEHPGITWTPPYPDRTPGRRPYADQVLDRIDRIYFSGQTLMVTRAHVVGESPEWSDLVYQGRWPSDHRAVVAEFSTK